MANIREVEGEDNAFSVLDAPSPAATDVDAPESQVVIEQLQRKGIKVRDFAYAPPYSSASIEAVPSAAHAASISVPPPTRTTEIFDPYRALTEIDYRWAQTERTFPVAGKTLRRLLDIGWLTVDELSTRGHAMDITALQAFDEHRAAAKATNGGVEVFPWRPLIAEGTQPPTGDVRRIMLGNGGGVWKQQDRQMVSHVAAEEWRRKQEEEAAEKMKELQELERERERERKRRGKRKMEEGADIDYRKEEREDLSSGPKRLRLSPSDDGDAVLSSHDASTHLLAPKKQYPAPLQAYNPKLYPDAASIIEASSQPRPSFPTTPPAIERTDTPPLDDGDDGGSKGGFGLIYHKKQRGLGRTQTFAELYVH